MYLDGVPFEIQTDHQALSWWQKVKTPTGRLARWIMFLQQFQYTLVYQKGSTNVTADALSRAPAASGEDRSEVEMFLLNTSIKIKDDVIWKMGRHHGQSCRILDTFH